MEKDFSQKLNESTDFIDIFEIIKEAAEKVLGKSRAGLMLGLANLGGSQGSYLGAYYPVASNMIVLNTFPLKRLNQTRKDLVKPYVFMVLLHEYIHSLGFLDEKQTRELTYKVCEKLFGSTHLTTEMAKDISRFLPAMSYPGYGWFPEKEPEIYIVSGFDKGHLTYVT